MILTITDAEINVPVDVEYKLVGILGGETNENSKVVGFLSPGILWCPVETRKGVLSLGAWSEPGTGAFSKLFFQWQY